MPGAAEISPRRRGNIPTTSAPMRRGRRRSGWLDAGHRAAHLERSAGHRSRATVGRSVVHWQMRFHLDMGSHRDLNWMDAACEDAAAHGGSKRAKSRAAAVSIDSVGGDVTTTSVAITAMQTTAAYSSAAAVDGGAGGGIIEQALRKRHGACGARGLVAVGIGARRSCSADQTKRPGSLRTPGHAVAALRASGA